MESLLGLWSQRVGMAFLSDQHFFHGLLETAGSSWLKEGGVLIPGHNMALWFL